MKEISCPLILTDMLESSVGAIATNVTVVHKHTVKTVRRVVVVVVVVVMKILEWMLVPYQIGILEYHISAKQMDSKNTYKTTVL